MEPFYAELAAEIRKKKPAEQELNQLKLALVRKHGLKNIPTTIDVFLNTDEEALEGLKLVTKPVRTLSGVATISIMTSPAGCPHGKCTFCPGGPGSVFGDVPQSYTGREPATMRALRGGFDSYVQVFSRLEQYAVIGQSFDKVELIIQGGTFPSMDVSYQNEFIAQAYKAMNDFSLLFFGDGMLNLGAFKKFFELPGNYHSEERFARIKKKMLAVKGDRGNETSSFFVKQEQKRNETAAVRCIGLTIETKPDWALLSHANQMLSLGCTRVELGIESVFEQALKLTNRGHTIAQTKESMRVLKDLGFKINAHYMLGLPGVKREGELLGLRALFEDAEFRPDMMKIYPLLVIRGTPLYLQWERGQYKPMSTSEAAEIISEFKRYVPKWVRIMRVNRDIPTYVTSAGIDKTNLRQYVLEKQQEKGIVCRCIRCREIGRHVAVGEPRIVVEEYEASGGKEFFIALEDNASYLYGFCRLRFPRQQLREEFTQRTAIIRELHVYSSAVSVGKNAGGGEMQHRGYGRKLMEKAEELARQQGKDKMLVISGIGAKEYYKKLGYGYDGVYMGKALTSS